ncbi:S8 family serine peptidase [Rossellomorea vietnamensis]|uniref:S8 family serine peptidase n=1 Tax=Rossellomorea vietnamensis TaxID=218284 RepID=A0A5D4NPP8_9BACI|nr:S8 family peptidase [Rossellomorea vietnamensis]TYS15438.1 S8 family serine peptidase [Rossellomorea vietnamensis]
MRGRRNRVKWLSIVLTLVLFIPLMFPPNSAAANPAQAKEKPSVSANETAKIKPQSKITSKLQDQFKKDKHVTYLVKFKEQADPAATAKSATDSAKKQKLSANGQKLLKRNMVVSELRSTALKTQADVKKYLAKQKKSGAVKEVKDFYVVNGMAVTSTKEVMEEIAAFSEVEKILPNETRQLIQPVKAEASTSAAVKEKSTQNSPSNIEWNIDQVGAPAVWEMGIDGAGTVVASIDTGVQWNHPALKEQYRGFDSESPESPQNEFNWFDATAGQSAPYDDQGHGTHVTGTMVGAEPDGSNQIGVAPGAKWIAVKAFTADGGTDADLLAAGEWILAPKDAEGNPHPEMAPDVVNNSWGGGSGLDEWYRPMVEAWRAAEIFPEFSAGNTTLFNPGGPGSIATPANYPESFATGATDINDQLGSFSLQGPSPYDEVKPDISAPGVNIRSAVPGSNYEGGWNGTSMAGPHVSAVAALLRQVDASLTVDEMEEILLNTAVPLTDSTFPESPNNGYGKGLVNAFDAVSSVMSGIGQVEGQVSKEGDDSEAPVISHEAPGEAFNQMNLPLQAEAADNISVTNVTLQYQNASGEWTTIDAVRTAGDHTSGTYEAIIPGEDLTGEGVTYKWSALDFGGNEVETEEYTVTLLPGISVGYEHDFESNPAGWTSYGEQNSWERGVPENGPGSAVSGENVFATSLAGTYANSANMSLQMPPVDLPEGSSFLQFKQWHELENNYDYGHVFVSTDAENWTQVLRVNGDTGEWVDGEVDLSEYAGQRIYIAFNVTTDGSVVKQGWYLDDVKLSGESILPSKKKNLGLKSKDKPSASVSKKPKVNPSKITVAVKKSAAAPDDSNPGPVLLPLQAEVNVLETGRAVYTNPADGSYSMTHAAGDFTLQASTYGYRSQSQSVTIQEDAVSTANFTLEEIPRGTVTGTVTNQASGEPVEGATIFLLEDAVVEPVETNENGEYELNAYEGEYTLKVVAPYYNSQEVAITVEGGKTTGADVSLEPFIGYPGEISYDDGTAENARVFNAAGNAWAVKMSLEEGNESALVTGGLFRFWDMEWPVPGGTEFEVAVYDASGTDGAPGKKVAGPFDAAAVRNGEWTHVDLSQHGIMVEGDFYMVYIQTNASPNSPGLGTDENGEYSGRNWQMVGGAWSPSPEDEGNYMIRATVNYEVTAPVITSPKDGSFTKSDTVTVEGTSAPSTTVLLFNGEEEVAAVETSEDGTFSAEAALQPGGNTITAKASTEQGTTGPSEPVTITLDQEKPVLEITSPEEGLKTNKEAITVTGTIADENLAWVKVNGQKASVNEGQFSHRMLLNEGENVIQVIAKDKAGNKKKQTVTVEAKFGDLAIDNLLPGEDKQLKKGESVKIEFDSEPGLDAAFVIHMPLTNAKSLVTNATELPMMETSEGHYVGYYTATSNVKAPGAVIEVKVSDEFGNVSTKRAEGKLYINTKK